MGPSPVRRRSWTSRILFTLMALLLGGCGWLFGWPPAGAPFDTGPVVVLGGGTGDRLALGREVVAASSGPRELVLSAEAADEWQELGGSCEDEGVRCVVPEPMNTFGEASTISVLAVEEEWEAVTVVTSEFHVTRTRLLFSYCMDTPTHVVASASGASVAARGRSFVRESLATVTSLPAYFHCP